VIACTRPASTSWTRAENSGFATGWSTTFLRSWGSRSRRTMPARSSRSMTWVVAAVDIPVISASLLGLHGPSLHRMEAHFQSVTLRPSRSATAEWKSTTAVLKRSPSWWPSSSVMLERDDRSVDTFLTRRYTTTQNTKYVSYQHT